MLKMTPISNNDSSIDNVNPQLTLPPWSGLVEGDRLYWRWRDGVLVHTNALAQGRHQFKPADLSISRYFVHFIYADQNRSASVRAAIKRVLSRLGSSDWGLNLGAGNVRLHPRLINIDLTRTPVIDIVTDGNILPFRSGVLRVVIAQEVLEHIGDFHKTIDEVYRVLADDGIFYCQVPFQIGHHPGPEDYWRFSCQGLKYLFENDKWRIEDVGTTLGYASGFYRILVEFVAVTASIIWDKLYIPAKATAALIFWPLKLLDRLAHCTTQRHRIAAGYFITVLKRPAAVDTNCP